MKYNVICATSVDDLIKWVNQKLKQGWKLQGGVATMTQNLEYTVFYQAIVKESSYPYKR